MPEEEFHGVADTLLETLHETMDMLVENEDIPDSDIEYAVSTRSWCSEQLVF